MSEKNKRCKNESNQERWHAFADRVHTELVRIQGVACGIAELLDNADNTETLNAATCAHETVLRDLDALRKVADLALLGRLPEPEAEPDGPIHRAKVATADV